MKVLLLGSLISAAQMEQLNSNSKEKASVAPVNYETMLANGMVENCWQLSGQNNLGGGDMWSIKKRNQQEARIFC